MTYDEAAALINVAGMRVRVARSRINSTKYAIDIFRTGEFGGTVRVMAMMQPISAAQREIIQWVEQGMPE